MVIKCCSLWILLVLMFTCDNVQCDCIANYEESDVVQSFMTKIVPNEFIVSFCNFYSTYTRLKYVRAALRQSNPSDWAVKPRNNTAAQYPSDFEVIRLNGNRHQITERIHLLKSHPTIKAVTAHQSVQRVLTYSRRNFTDESVFVGRRLLRAIPRQVTGILQANALWSRGITGKGVKVAVFDTGLSKNHPHFRKVKERTNWTSEKSLDDGVSHGTFVAGVIASTRECLGFAPDAELHIYRIFTNNQVSYTSWFLDAFNYAIFRRINILNLSIGGPDFLDYPFVEKVLELSANKVIMVSAVGNDGPLYGTLNNPADQSDVIGVGGINFERKMAKFSSRGMTTWELPQGYGRLKPDIVTYGSQVKGSNLRTGCRVLSGTSVASPVVAGAITLLASGARHKLDIINPASMKQVLIAGSSRLPDINMFEQGHGMLNIVESMNHLLSYTPRVTLSPAYLNFAETYMWPYSSQAMFCSGAPVIVNVTILNGISVAGEIIVEPEWFSYPQAFGEYLNVSITHSSILWPWSGWMAVHLLVNEKGCEYEGEARGHIRITVQNPSPLNKSQMLNSSVHFPITVKIIPRPPRHKRILWDQYHSLRYPPGYIPHDILRVKSDPLDWRADHIHTNFRDLYTHLRNSGYYVDVLRKPFTCFDASHYGSLLIVDPEEEFFDEEIVKIQNDVYDAGLGVIVFADWYNTTVMKKIKFFDENTRQWWLPDTGGSNVPALNDLLKPFGIAFSDFIAEGYFQFGDHGMYYGSGSTIAKFPVNNGDDIVIGAQLLDQGREIIHNSSETGEPGAANGSASNKPKYFVPILGLMQANQVNRRKYVGDGNASVTPSSYEKMSLDTFDEENGIQREKNPILNKRILLNVMDVADEQSLSSPLITKSPVKRLSPLHSVDSGPRTHSTEGRLAVYGDSSCLDSTHLEKACYWLLDALLEFTMIGHRSSLLINHNKIKDFKLHVDRSLPLRLANNNLHKYSKVLQAEDRSRKRPLESCERLRWSRMRVVNYTDAKALEQLAVEESRRQFAEYVAMLQENGVGSNEAGQRFLNVMTDDLTRDRLADGRIEENSPASFTLMRTSLAFVMLLTLIVVYIFLKFFRRWRLRSSSLIL